MDFCPGCDNPGCRHGGCQGRMPLVRVKREPLPRPEVEVTNVAGEKHVVISRDGKAKSYKVEGASEDARLKDAVKKVVDDPHTAEWLP